VSEAFPRDAARTAAFAKIEVWRQAATLGVQLFLTGAIVRTIGVSATLAVLPIVTLAGLLALWSHPTLSVLIAVQVIRHATHHAVDRPTREMLYTVVGPDARYKSKSFIDTVIYRFGDVSGTWLDKAVGLIGLMVMPVAITAAAIWAGIGVALGVMNQRKQHEIPSPSVGSVCANCQYNLRGLEAAALCPECGSPLTPTAPAGS
jgi:AAA family ATP:ADP antiporter